METSPFSNCKKANKLAILWVSGDLLAYFLAFFGLPADYEQKKPPSL